MCCLQGTLCFELTKGVPSAFVALVIGGIAALIAYRQYRAARAKLSLDLFERRYKIFEQTWAYTSKAALGKAMDKQDRLFQNITPIASFLFGKSIKEYLELLIQKRSFLEKLSLDHAQGTGDSETRIRAMDELLDYFRKEAREGVYNRFSGYLDFSTWT